MNRPVALVCYICGREYFINYIDLVPKVLEFTLKPVKRNGSSKKISNLQNKEDHVLERLQVFSSYYLNQM